MRREGHALGMLHVSSLEREQVLRDCIVVGEYIDWKRELLTQCTRLGNLTASSGS